MAGAIALWGRASLIWTCRCFKNNYVKRISEHFNVQFRVEVFNILNHTNFNPPTANLQVFNGDGSTGGLTPGLLDTTSTTSRQVQFAVKVIW